MRHLESVRRTGDNRYHWVAKGPAGSKVEWDAEIVNDVANELIAWRSLEGSDVESAGSVHFDAASATGIPTTVVRVKMNYRPLGGAVGAAVAELLGEDPGRQVADDMRRFKEVVETGEAGSRSTTDQPP
jgi:uncharacterized membrane protein